MADLLKVLGVAGAAYGLSKLLEKKPDGSNVDQSGTRPNINEGNAERSTGTTEPRATDDVTTGKSKVKLDLSSGISLSKKLPNLVPNPLHEFASYSVLWTLACLETKQFNNPALYRNSLGDLQNVVFSSGGRANAQRVKTYNGTPEYYINNFSMRANVAANEKTGNTNAFGFSFDIIEPYSMGLLLQSMQNAASNAGYADYLEAPYVLRMDIVGWDENGREFKNIKPKFFTIGLTEVTFQVTESGSTYKVNAIPFNQKAFSDDVNILYNDVKIIAGQEGTVEELLKTGENSLIRFLNEVEDKLVKEKKIEIADVYDIQFPENSSSFVSTTQVPGLKKATLKPFAREGISVGGQTVDVSTSFLENKIGKASLGFTQGSGGNFKFVQPADAYDEKTGVVNRDKLTIDTKNRTFQFAQGQSIIQIITQIITASEYAWNAIKSENVKNGFIDWFRIDVQIEFLDFDNSTGDFARKYTFRVVPFKAHHSVFTNPNTKPQYDWAKEQVCKGYDYIYTGENSDIIKFDINIDKLFYTGIPGSAEKDAGKSSDPNLKGTVPDPPKGTETGKGASPGATSANTGRARIRKDPGKIRKPVGGSGDEKTQQIVAQSFHDAFVSNSSADMIKVNLEIIGDTYWIVDSGFGNYFSPADSTAQVTDDGTMNYESGDVLIYLTFRTPGDVDEATGLYQFSRTSKESPFSGIYRVIECESVFTDGKFTQKLNCIRMPGQALDYVDGDKQISGIANNDKSNIMTTEVGEDVKEKTSPTEEIYGSEGE